MRAKCPVFHRVYMLFIRKSFVQIQDTAHTKGVGRRIAINRETATIQVASVITSAAVKRA